ncbi:antitoxin MazE7 [Streptomyces sp. HUCO-GS316]|uniref:antitoxin MazE7 n=1 Tax=Streptomyces sp. HUCO-GS316 TaxID=2692198 RepID=UPI00136FEAFE|nr:antitoxin MazE7 [Streptomyces sp. HUCO-GS316]MXM66124.1 antitoxin MazE7 [Streptomyces sp. HUCO-GS316]
MADTSVRINTDTRDRLAALAKARGMSLAAYLDDLSQQEERQALLGRATASFEAALDRPGFAEAFDAAFGGLPEPPTGSHSTHRAA